MRLDVPNYLFVDNHCVDPGDPELGTWSREALEAMNARFADQLERAFAGGLESRESARGQVKLRVGLPRWATPLTREVQEGLWRSSAASPLVMVAR